MRRGVHLFPRSLTLVVGLLAAAIVVGGLRLPAEAVSSAPASVPGVEGERLDGEAETPAEASDEARRMGERVEVLRARRPDRRVFANPDGTWTEEVTPGPERGRDAAGQWGLLDLTLVERAGRVSARVSAQQVSFSGGGDRELVSWRVKGEQVAWRWPEALPAPTLAGPRATYADVVPGGDLVVTATPDGFSYSIVLREPPGDRAEDP